MIRKLELKDIPLINNLINDVNYVVDEYELNKNAYVFIKDETIIAFISFSIFYERAELNYIFVKSEYRKQHIASKLMEKMIDILKNKDVKTIDLEVNSLNEKAINLYNKYDFKVVNIRKKYYNGIDALLMLKEIRW